VDPGPPIASEGDPKGRIVSLAPDLSTVLLSFCAPWGICTSARDPGAGAMAARTHGAYNSRLV